MDAGGAVRVPLYEYQCAKCGTFELIRKFSDVPLIVCPTCGSEVSKLFSAPAIQFKGTGWYITDYARKSSGGEASKAEGGKDTGSGETGSKDSGAKESGSKESGAKESGSKESGAKESGSKESGAKESGAKDSGTSTSSETKKVSPSTK